MSRIVVVCEKPSAARHMADALLGSRMSGTRDGNNIEIVSLLGHLYEMESPDKQVSSDLVDKYKSWDLDNLPWDINDIAWKMKPRPKVGDVVKRVKQTCAGADEIVCATDDDPGTHEGSGLFCEVMIQNKITCPRFSRMYFADESKKELVRAFDTRVDIPSIDAFGEWQCAWLRERWDWLSMQWTRVSTKLAPNGYLLRQGRLKSAMVSLVGEQVDKVNAYQKIPYYQNRFRDENGIVYVDANEPMHKLRDDVVCGYVTSNVCVDSKTIKHTAPPRLMDIATLSARLAPLGINAKTVLTTYQKMYEAQVVSYPRTEDKKITIEQFNELLGVVDKIANVCGVDPRELTERSPRKTHVGEGMAHGANRPGLNVPDTLDDLDDKYGHGAKKIYELLARNYLAMLMPDYEYEHQVGHLEKYPTFSGCANVAKSAGWKSIFNDIDETLDNESKLGLGSVAEPFIFEGYPPRPANPTWNWLRKQLERRNVGTGATRTSIYSDVTNQKAKCPLLIDKRGRISMTEYGQMSFKLLKGTHIGNLEITEQLFRDLALVEKDEKNPKDVLAQVACMVREDIDTMKKNAEEYSKKEGINMSNNDERFTGTWNGREVRIKRKWAEHRFSDAEVQKLLNGETLELHNLTSKKGSQFSAALKIGENSFTNEKGEEVKYIGIVSNFLETIPQAFCKHTFTDAERKSLEAGEVIYVDDYVSKKGSKFSANTRWGKRDDGRMGIIFDFDN